MRARLLDRVERDAYTRTLSGARFLAAWTFFSPGGAGTMAEKKAKTVHGISLLASTSAQGADRDVMSYFPGPYQRPSGRTENLPGSNLSGARQVHNAQLGGSSTARRTAR